MKLKEKKKIKNELRSSTSIYILFKYFILIMFFLGWFGSYIKMILGFLTSIFNFSNLYWYNGYQF